LLTNTRDPAIVFRTFQSVRPEGKTGRTAGGSPSFFESMNGLGKMEVGLDALQGPVGPCGVFLLHFFGWYDQKPQVRGLISLIVYDQAGYVPYS